MMVLVAWLARLFGVSVSRLLVSIALLGAIFAGIAYTGHRIFAAGETHNQAKTDKQNQRFEDATDEARARVRECYDTGGVYYDPWTRKCQRP